MTTHPLVERIAQTLVLGDGLSMIKETCGPYKLIEHWLQGEFHHDLLLHLSTSHDSLPGAYLIISINCNGGIKEVLCFEEPPARWALWHDRCPQNPEFEGKLPAILARSRTLHWFDPCELLLSTARSELKPEHRERQRGGGWVMKPLQQEE